MKQKKRLRNVVLLTAFVSVIMLFLGEAHLLKLMELKAFDFKFFLRGFHSCDDRIFLIGIDDLALKVLGAWPWPRSYHAALLETLSHHPPSALGFDIFFRERRPEKDQDDALVSAVQKFDSLNFGAYLDPETRLQEKESWKEKVLSKFALTRIRDTRKEFTSDQNVEMSFQDLAQVSSIGFLNAPRDIDGALRRIPLLVDFQGRVYPSLSLKLIMDYYGVSAQKVDFFDRSLLVLESSQGAIKIPVTADGFFWINFRSGIENVRGASFPQILQKEVDLAKNIVLVGLTGTGLTDVAPTPLSANTPLVLAHVNTIQNILGRDFLKMMPSHWEWMILWAGILGMVLLSYLSNWTLATAGAFLGIVLFTLFNFYLFFVKGIQLAWIKPVLAMALAYASSTALRLWGEEREKRWIREAFGRFVSPSVLGEILNNPKGLKLGGGRAELTILFSDIRSFSSYCEKVDPEVVVAQLNEYFEEMTRILFANGGTLDKFMGDGLMAIFGAPVRLQENHAMCAVRAAYQMQEKMKQLREMWIQGGKEPLSIGVGINSGSVIAGNMGSRQVMNYTVIGDEVNLAARLEALTRQFQADIIVSSSTFSFVKDCWNFKSLGETKVKGKEKNVTIYELIGPKSGKLTDTIG